MIYGLLVDLLKNENTIYNIRGIRDEKDFAYENNMTKINKQMMPSLVTIYLPCLDSQKDISSTLAREKILNSGDLSCLPKEIIPLL